MSIQQNVQQQNAQTTAEIQRVAGLFKKERSRFSWLGEALNSHGLSEEAGALVRLSELPDQGGNLMSGIWLAAPREFWEFSILLSRGTRQIIDVEEFSNVTPSVPVVEATRGCGSSFGYLALQVLNDMPKSTP